jgi:hypothetical protein
VPWRGASCLFLGGGPFGSDDSVCASACTLCMLLEAVPAFERVSHIAEYPSSLSGRGQAGSAGGGIASLDDPKMSDMRSRIQHTHARQERR